ncbi:MAG: hypothetical protein K6G63_11055 [Eubacterium sp.]|nr:hypothetical protein [Eubacterium sp.]
MNTTANQIAKLVTTTNPSAAFTTHALSELGNGNMQNGLRRIVTYFTKEAVSNKRLGRIQGGAVGFGAATLLFGGVAYLWYRSDRKHIEIEGREIMNTLQPAELETSSEISDVEKNQSKISDFVIEKTT